MKPSCLNACFDNRHAASESKVETSNDAIRLGGGLLKTFNQKQPYFCCFEIQGHLCSL